MTDDTLQTLATGAPTSPPPGPVPKPRPTRTGTPTCAPDARGDSMVDHPCPFTVGELMALHAIAHGRGDLVEVLTRRRKAA